MTESTSPSPELSAGALLRAAREKQGIHVAALATMLKVPPKKLEALEADRHNEFQGATFVRALAQAACRALKIDPAPILERLPELDSGVLSQLGGGLNAPFRERGVRRESAEVPVASRAVMLVVLLLLLGAVAFWFWPAGLRPRSLQPSPAASEPASGVSTEPINIPAPVVPPPSAPSGLSGSGSPTVLGDSNAAVVGSPTPAPGPASVVLGTAAHAAPPAASPAVSPSTPAALVSPSGTGGAQVQVRVRQASWVEVIDAKSLVLVSRTLTAGETVTVDGASPMHVKIGNVAGTELSFRGKPVDLTAAARDNVAKLELK